MATICVPTALSTIHLLLRPKAKIIVFRSLREQYSGTYNIFLNLPNWAKIQKAYILARLVQWVWHCPHNTDLAL